MFSFEASDELVFGAPNPSEIRQDLMIEQQALTEETTLINFSSDKRVMNSGLTRQTHETEIITKKRVVHRDVERKRRLEMSNLLLTLASLLPAQHNKGKRGVLDEMQEAANYIKSMQNKIEELRIRRDKLINLSQNEVVISDGPCVKINVLSDGMEILIKTNYSFGLSVALDVLLAETEIDDNVVNCVSTPTNPGLLHKIQIQAKDMRSLDLSLLQEKLSKAISS